MRNKLGFKWRPPFHIQHLTTVQIQQRIEFRRDILATFGNESGFCLGPDSM
jgi:hypothetical protein